MCCVLWLWHMVKGFSIVNETEVDVFLEFPCFLYDPVSVGNLVSGSSAFCKPRLNIWKFSIHVMLKPSLKDFEHNLTSMGDDCNSPVVWTFSSIALLGDWDGLITCESLYLLKLPHSLGFPGSSPGGSDSQEPACHVRDLGSIPGSGRSPGEGNGNPLQYSLLGKFHGQWWLVGYSPWGHKESDYHFH